MMELIFAGAIVAPFLGLGAVGVGKHIKEKRKNEREFWIMSGISPISIGTKPKYIRCPTFY